MAKLAASEAATAISHQVSIEPLGTAPFPSLVSGTSPSLCLFPLLGHPDPGRHGVRVRDASRALLPRCPHH